METATLTSLQSDIESRLADSEPDVEVLLAEVSGTDVVRVFIDHPDGVTIGLCERVTKALGDLRERYAVEVSSPGRNRPLTRPAHYQRFVGRRARVRLAAPLALAEAEEPQASLAGEIVVADGDAVTLATASGLVAVPYADVRRANLIED
jgi:ribosome maturation factor RimP